MHCNRQRCIGVVREREVPSEAAWRTSVDEMTNRLVTVVRCGFQGSGS